MIFRTTNEDGRCPGLIGPQALTPSLYKLRFETGPYWETLGQTSFYPYVEVSFNSHTNTLPVVQLCRHIKRLSKHLILKVTQHIFVHFLYFYM